VLSPANIFQEYEPPMSGLEADRQWFF